MSCPECGRYVPILFDGIEKRRCLSCLQAKAIKEQQEKIKEQQEKREEK